MVVDFILQSLINFFSWVISLMPNFTGLPQGITDTFTFLQTFWDTSALIFPINTLFQILALTITIEIAILGWKIWWFVYNKIPGKFT